MSLPGAANKMSPELSLSLSLALQRSVKSPLNQAMAPASSFQFITISRRTGAAPSSTRARVETRTALTMKESA